MHDSFQLTLMYDVKIMLELKFKGPRTKDMKKVDPYDAIRGGREVVVHLGVTLDFYQCSQGLEVRHLICPNIQDVGRYDSIECSIVKS